MRLKLAKEKQSLHVENWMEVIFSDKNSVVNQESVLAKVMMLELMSGAIQRKTNFPHD